MRPNALAITGLGMVSSLGWNAVSSCAAARAGISRAAVLDHFERWDEEAGEPVPVIGHRVPRRMEGFEGIGRLARLGMLALQDLKTQTELTEATLARTGLFINLASGYYREQMQSQQGEREEGRLDLEEMKNRENRLRADLPRLLVRLSEISAVPGYQRVIFEDQAGVCDLVAQAGDLLQRGVLDRCIIGGIDTVIDSERLEELSVLGLVKGSEAPDGWVPGEAAAFIVVERLDGRLARGGKIQGIVETPVMAREPTHRFSDCVSAGVALSEVVAQAVAPEKGGGGTPRVLIGGLNGDRWRAMEWGCALVRLRARGLVEEVEEWHPALSFGETGAAAGAVAIVMAVRALARGYARGQRIALWTSSDSGLKAACCLFQP